MGYQGHNVRREPALAMPDALYKYMSVDTARQVLTDGTLRWSSPELLEDPWFIGHDTKLGFDHLMVNKAMLNTAVSMLFTRDIPAGNKDHPLYKAICRWRAEDRFKDEAEAWDALSELLAPTPETLQQRLAKIVSGWQELVANSRVICFSDTPKEMQSWMQYADKFEGLVMRFEPTGTIAESKPVDYSVQRPHLTTIREQVNDLVGIKQAMVEDKFESKLLSKAKHLSHEREWRCIRLMDEQDLDCGEDVQDWYMDEPIPTDSLKAIYFGFKMPTKLVSEISQLVKTSYPGTTIYTSSPIEEQFDIEFDKFICVTPP